MSTYQNITKEDMEGFLCPLGFVPMTLQGVRELVYGRIFRDNGLCVSMRVYTGIEPSGDSRERGKDAIRLELYWRDDKGTVRRLGGSKRVHRVKGWRDNLKSRIDGWRKAIGEPCPSCRSPMVERDGRNGAFYGCCRYPECKGTCNVT